MPYYQRPSNIYSRLNRYVDATLKFKIDSAGNSVLRKGDIQNRVGHVAIPRGINSKQLRAVNRSINRAKKLGVKLIITGVD